MAKINQTIFICDTCQKEESTLYGEGFPYDKGWKYVYNMFFKKSDKREAPLIDAHFCGINCLVKKFRELFKS